MSMPKVKLHVQAIPKTLVRVGCAGDFLKNATLGTLPDQMIRNAQQGVAEGIIQTLWVTGVDANGIPRDRFWLKFDPLDVDVKVMLDLSDGKSTLEAVDVSLAGGVQTAVQVLTRKRLRPVVTFDYTAEALANPARLEEAKKRLGFVAAPFSQPEAPPLPPPRPQPVATASTEPWQPTYAEIQAILAKPTHVPPAGFQFKNAVTLTPAKDTGMHFGWDSLRQT